MERMLFSELPCWRIVGGGVERSAELLPDLLVSVFDSERVLIGGGVVFCCMVVVGALRIPGIDCAPCASGAGPLVTLLSVLTPWRAGVR